MKSRFRNGFCKQRTYGKTDTPDLQIGTDFFDFFAGNPHLFVKKIRWNPKIRSIRFTISNVLNGF
jgi:hypothetical protein